MSKTHVVDPAMIAALQEAVEDADLRTGRMLLGSIAATYGYDALVLDVFEPLLTTIGERMRRNEIPLAQSYMFSALAEEMMDTYGAVSGGATPEGAPLKGPVVMANIEDDCHPLGRKIVSSLLRIHGWQVYDLGIDVEAETIVDEAIKTGASAIGVSAMIFSTAENIIRVRRAIDASGYNNRIRLVVGGAVFRLRPELVEEVGADATAPNAFSALAIFDALEKQRGKESS